MFTMPCTPGWYTFMTVGFNLYREMTIGLRSIACSSLTLIWSPSAVVLNKNVKRAYTEIYTFPGDDLLLWDAKNKHQLIIPILCLYIVRAGITFSNYTNTLYVSVLLRVSKLLMIVVL